MNAVLAGIVVLTLFALLMDTLVTRLERRLLVWQPTAGKSEKARAGA
jgi:NitT/TauT family transport system permease protein